MVAGRLMRSIDKAWGGGLRACRDRGREHPRLPPQFCVACAGAWRKPADDRAPARHSEEQTTERYAHLDRHWVREGAIRISESLATDVLTGYTGRPRTVREDTRGGAAGSLLAFPAQFRGKGSVGPV